MFNENAGDGTAAAVNHGADEPNLTFMIHDSLARFQYYDSQRRKTPLEPEKLLMVAVLEDAISCYQRYAGSQRRKWQRVFNDAETWFMEEDGDWLFSFANICDVLGLSPGFIRAGLLRWKERQPSDNSRCRIYRFNASRRRTKPISIRFSRAKKIASRTTRLYRNA